MSNGASIQAAQLAPSSLQQLPSNIICNDNVNGFCPHGEECTWSHEISAIQSCEPPSPTLRYPENVLSMEPRASLRDSRPFDDDGPGELSVYGPRHDNDHVHIKHIKILPTTNEILSRRPPYMPKKDPFSPHRLPSGQQRLLDIHFRLLRYESTESIIDACYHASQQLVRIVSEPKLTDYDDRMLTSNGFRYSLFRDLRFEELDFSDRKSMTVRVSFACPKALRGRRLGPSSHLEEGMLVALVGLDQHNALSTTFMEISMRQTTEAMRPRTGNDLRASAVLSFADPTDTDAVRRLLYNSQGLLQESPVLVEIPNALYAGFYWTLRQLQNQANGDDRLAFSDTIAPLTPGASPTVSPPQYSTGNQFVFQLDSLRKEEAASTGHSLILRPSDFLSTAVFQRDFIDQLCLETTLDRGQANALCENLCRGFAFTQGPPGTGKTYLGVSLARVILESRPHLSRKPILVVCMTNHALDSFLEGIRDAGIVKLARLGRSSKEGWTQAYHISTLSRHMKKTSFEKSNLNLGHTRVDCLSTEGISWCRSLNEESLCWPAVRELLKAKYPATFDRFAGLEKVSGSALSDIRLARKAGGFAYEYWCTGGDIKDVDRLLEKFNAMLGNDYAFEDEANANLKTRQRVMDDILWNVSPSGGAQTLAADDIWNLNLNERQSLLRQWKEEMDPKTVLDKTAEIHRRHQAALVNRNIARGDIESRCLEQQDVIAMTTTACAMNWATLNKIGLQTVICEEAGEVMEAQFLCTLFPSVEHSISIGDPLQLRPQVNERTLSLETEIGSSYRLDESLIERMMLPSTRGVNPIPSSRLNVQRRMHPEIANILRATLYPYLEDHETTYDREPVPVMVDRVWWLDHQIPEDARDPRSSAGTSSSNTFEVEMTVGLVEHLVNSNEYDFRDITILTPYNAQLAALTKRFDGICSLWLSEKDRETLLDEGLLDPAAVSLGTKTDVQISSMLRLATVDNFQGEESRVIILSTVRSNPGGLVGFLRTPNRINVGCSRARNGFYIIGNASLMRKVDMWTLIIDDFTAKEKIGPAFRTCCPRHPDRTYFVHSPEEWRSIPDCPVPCGAVLACGHICSMNCHAPVLHERVGCSKPCPRLHDICKHACSKTCGELCGDCEFPLQTVVLSCGHEAIKRCAETRETNSMDCNALLERVELPCGHSAERRCSTAEEPLKCQEKCSLLLPCNHQCRGSCYDCTLNGQHPKCTVVCSQGLNCGHQCLEICHKDKGPCPPCRSACQRSCGHGDCTQPCGVFCDPCVKRCKCGCPHAARAGCCTTMCCLPCDRVPCNHSYTKTFPCGHLYLSVCGEISPEQCPQCNSGRISTKTQLLLPCGHAFDLDFLDNHVGIFNLYELDENGRLLGANVLSYQAFSSVTPYCPDCGADCRQVKRYELYFKLSDLEGNLDRLYAKFSRKLHMFMEQMYWTKVQLDQTFAIFSKTLKPSPLSGRTNEELISNRGGVMNELLNSVAKFRDDVVHQFDHDIDRLEAFLGIPVAADEIGLTSAYKLRFDALIYRGRLILMEESSRMLVTLRGLKDPSQHTLIMIEGMERLLIREAERLLADMKTVIAGCEAKNLKRLEAEARLIQINSYLVLRNQGVDGDLMIDDSFQKTLELCQTFPDTAGRFLNTYTSMKQVVAGTKDMSNLYTKGAQNLWWTWPKHHIDHLEHCRYGHPYSAATASGCLECGREVPKPPKPVDPNSLLREKDFLEAMKNFTFKTVWRGG